MTKWVFREDEILNNCMFVLADSATATSIYVTDEFKQRVLDFSYRPCSLKDF